MVATEWLVGEGGEGRGAPAPPRGTYRTRCLEAPQLPAPLLPPPLPFRFPARSGVRAWRSGQIPSAKARPMTGHERRWKEYPALPVLIRDSSVAERL